MLAVGSPFFAITFVVEVQATDTLTSLPIPTNGIARTQFDAY